MKTRLLLLTTLLAVAMVAMGQQPQQKREEYKIDSKFSEQHLWMMYGILDAAGNVVCPYKYQQISETWDVLGRWSGYHFAVRNGKMGIYDARARKEIVPCQFEVARETECVDGMFVVGNIDQLGIYDTRQQKLITPLKYKDISFYQLMKQDYCQVDTKNGAGLIDKQGKEFLSPDEYTYIGWMGKLYIVTKGGGYMQYRRPTGGSYALYDIKKRAFVTPFKYTFIGDRKVKWDADCECYIENEGLIPFCVGGQFVSFKNSSREGIPQINGGKWGFMDEDGKEVIPAQYDYVTAFNEGMAQVTKNGVTSVLHNPLKQKPAGGKLGKEVDGNVPETSKSDENLFAFVIANENYAHLKGADYAINDGKVFAEYCKKTLGVPEKNVRYYEDATYGNIVGAMNKMKEIAEVYEGDAKIIFYFAGLGATDTQSKERYLIPADGSLETLKSTGYSVASLQKALNDMNTTYTLAVIDAPFSNVDRNGKMLAAARGVRIAPKRIAPQGKTVICTSSMNDETAYASKDYGHGLFTFALLQQLQQTKGNGTLKELIDNASKWTRKEVLKLFDQRQTPQQTVSTEMEQKWQNIKFE